MPSDESSAPLAAAPRQDAAEFRQLALDALDGAHRELLTRGILRVLATDIAEETYAQIIDGLPLLDVLCDSEGGLLHRDHPIHDVHDELCPGMLEKTREFRDNFTPETLRFDSRVNCQKGSRWHDLDNSRADSHAQQAPPCLPGCVSRISSF